MTEEERKSTNQEAEKNKHQDKKKGKIVGTTVYLHNIQEQKEPEKKTFALIMKIYINFKKQKRINKRW